jgi:segregation and condensation protein A
MVYQVKLEQYEGPLDLLLRLIEEEKLDISQISLAQITDEFIRYLSLAPISLDELADFIVVAAKLLLIKSEKLLPGLEIEEEEPLLEEQLKIYKQYWDAAKEIEKIIQRKQFVFFREKMPVEPAFRPPKRLTSQELAVVFQEIVKQLEFFVQPTKQITLKAISLEERIHYLKELILKKLFLSFNDLIKTKDKAEKIVHFLALLELIKQRIVKIEQEGLFGEIIIKKA